MSILDTFVLMFTGDSTQAVKASEEAVKAGEKASEQINKTGEASKKMAGEIVAENSAIKKAFESLGVAEGMFTSQLLSNVGKIAGSFAAMFGVEKLFHAAISQAFTDWNELNDAKEFGTSVENLDAWGKAVKRVGGNAQEFTQSLKNINERVAAMAVMGSKGGRTKIFEELGIDPSKSANVFQNLLQISAKMQTMGMAEQRALGRRVGFDEGTLRLLRQGPAAIQAIIDKEKQFGVLTQEEAEQGKKFALEWLGIKTDMDEIFRMLVLAIDSFLLPALEAIVSPIHEIVGYLAHHKNLIIGFFIAIAGAALVAAEAMGLANAAAAVFAFLTSPITLTVMAVLALAAAFALLYDDIKGFLDGQVSVTGYLAQRWPIVGIVVRDVAAAFGEMKDLAVNAFHAIAEWIEAIPEGFRQWKEIVSEVIDWIKSKFEELPTGVKSAFGVIGTIISGDVEIFKALFSTLGPAFGLTFDAIVGAAKAAYDFLAAVFHLIADLVVNPEHAFENFAKRVEENINNVGKTFSELGDDFKLLSDVAVEAINRILNVFGSLGSMVKSTVGAVGGAISSAGTWIGKHLSAPSGSILEGMPMTVDPDNPVPGTTLPGQRTTNAINAHRDAVAGLSAAANTMGATDTPLMAQTPLSLQAGAMAANGPASIDKSLHVGSITITTTGPQDAASIAEHLDEHLAKHYTDNLMHIDDGVSH